MIGRIFRFRPETNDHQPLKQKALVKTHRVPLDPVRFIVRFAQKNTIVFYGKTIAFVRMTGVCGKGFSDMHKNTSHKIRKPVNHKRFPVFSTGGFSPEVCAKRQQTRY